MNHPCPVMALLQSTFTKVAICATTPMTRSSHQSMLALCPAVALSLLPSDHPTRVDRLSAIPMQARVDALPYRDTNSFNTQGKIVFNLKKLCSLLPCVYAFSMSFSLISLTFCKNHSSTRPYKNGPLVCAQLSCFSAAVTLRAPNSL